MVAFASNGYPGGRIDSSPPSTQTQNYSRSWARLYIRNCVVKRSYDYNISRLVGDNVAGGHQTSRYIGWSSGTGNVYVRNVWTPQIQISNNFVNTQNKPQYKQNQDGSLSTEINMKIVEGWYTTNDIAVKLTSHTGATMSDINWSPTYANNFILTSNQIGIFEPAAIGPGDFGANQSVGHPHENLTGGVANIWNSSYWSYDISQNLGGDPVVYQPDWSNNSLDIKLVSQGKVIYPNTSIVSNYLINYTDYNNKNMKEWLTIVTDNTTGIAGYLHIVDISNTDNFAVYTLNSHTQVTNDYGNVGVTFVRAYPLSYALTDNKKYRLQLVSGGSRGAQGHQGITGYTGFQGYQGYQGYQGDIVNWWDTYESTYDINYSGSAPNNQTFGAIYSSSYVIDISGAGAGAISDDIVFSLREAEAQKFRLENLVIAGIVKEETDIPSTGYKTYTLLRNIHIIVEPGTQRLVME